MNEMTSYACTVPLPPMCATVWAEILAVQISGDFTSMQTGDINIGAL